MSNCMQIFETDRVYIELVFEVHYINKTPYGVYIVRHYNRIGDMIGYPSKEYTTPDLKKAKTTFNRYRRLSKGVQ